MMIGQAQARLMDGVAQVVTDAANDIIMPRYRGLAAGEIFLKSKNELVTAVDRAMEERLIGALAALDPTIRAIGEEGVEAGTATLDGLGVGRAWLIDPLDGTSNYAHGSGAFGVMIALIEDGVTTTSWIHDPVRRTMAISVGGEGVFVDGWRVSVHAPERDRLVASVAGLFMPAERRDSINRVAEQGMELRPIPRCAAAHYPMLARGEHDVAIFQRTLPWDHAAGALLLTEAGGVVTRWNGAAYSVADDGFGIIAAGTHAGWRQGFDALHAALDAIGDDGAA